MTDNFDRMKAQKDEIAARDQQRLCQPAFTRIYDILAGINDNIEVGDDGYARFASVNDRDRLRALVQELEPAALAFHSASGVP